MSKAWETTDEDVLNVIQGMGNTASEDIVQGILSTLDQYSIESAALYGNSMEDQTNYAYEEIKKQIIEKNLL